ncbi:hypothetical protein ABIF38_008733 [Bradyrhizobium japonicum]|uniref:hypothetical protein n=1 Tax=Bradyrhizobium elkanii TaxID=29448 RepID=UPI0003775461|nr:hypothetical protein [Bradyrhizobium elkanii]MCP1728950.1 hypothetical protein [Bradyrhizobium elkanii]MCS3573076.1 hypothetical protein [Bradyrhizobium elkanii]MCS3594232.1 hypothetical protein [Bradyrhizobium elkanii]MCS3623675.1 hypothetical protein [Bradyrhizobium elkanii]UQD79885.1 hypothetical protein JEY66_34240 [Bradyrhizobium elkanii USDA 76]
MTNKIVRRNLKSGLFAFIDLLGFSARVEAIINEEQLRALDDEVVHVQNEFEHKSTDRFIREEHKIVGKTVLAFSDCLVISVPLHSKVADSEGTFDLLMSELTSYAWAQGTCVLRGIFLRGGVDLGFWYRRKDTLISPALVRAYRLEHAACVPMIAITPDLQTYLSDHPHRKYYSDDVDPTPKTLMQYSNLPNGQTQWFINYLRICLDTIEPTISGEDRDRYQAEDQDGRDRMRTEAWQNACRDWARQHRNAILTAYASAGNDESVRAKYAWLFRYHNEEIGRFFGEEAQALSISQDE